MHGYFFSLMVIGIAALGMAWMPAITRLTKISYSLIYVLAGMLVFSLTGTLPFPDPFDHKEFTLHLTELVVIISLMGTGLKIDEKFSFKQWRIPFKLVVITMILCIGIVTWLGAEWLEMPIASALLLAAALAPTDPVLASDVQVGPPLENTPHTVRFSLTAEAGLNDGMAFPFTWLAIMLSTTDHTYTEWALFYLLYKVFAGVIMGYILGRFIAYLVFDLPGKFSSLYTRDGFVALSATLLTYGATEMVSGYGFIAVFITALTLRNYQMDHKYHRKLHAFMDEVERMLLAIVLLLLGGTIVHGIFDPLTWKHLLMALLFLFVIRPACAMLTLINTKISMKEKLAISFLGIRGIGSFFYLAFAFTMVTGFQEREIWALVSLIVFLSVIIHGLTASRFMQKFEKDRNN